MLGLQTPNSGEIELNKNRLYQKNQKLPFKIGYVPQDVYLLDDTIKKIFYLINLNWKIYQMIA